MKLPLTGGAYEGRTPVMSAETMINLYTDYRLGNQDPALVGTPGTALWQALTNQGEVRGLTYDGENLFVVVDQTTGKLLHIDLSSGVEVDVSGSEAITGSGPVSIVNNGTDNGREIVICNGSGVWVYSWNGGVDSGFDSGFRGSTPITGSLVELATPATSNTATWLDGRFIMDDQDNRGRFYYSELYDARTVNELNFATAEGAPDGLVAVIADRRQLYLFGETTTEVWYTTADPNRPYARFQGGFMQVGCMAALSVKRFDNSIAWLGRDEHGYGRIMRLGNNYAPEVISPPAINYQISTYADVSDAFAFTMRWQGHEWYVITFPSVVHGGGLENGTTWVFDAVSKEWFQWRFGSNFRHMANCAASLPFDYVGGPTAPFIVIGDYRGDDTAAHSNLYYLSETTYTDYDETVVGPPANVININRERTTVHVNLEQDRTRITSLQLDCLEGGSGNIGLEISKDGGLSFGTKVTKSTGANNDDRVIWRQLGYARNWVFRLTTSMTSRVAWLNLWGKLWGEPGR